MRFPDEVLREILEREFRKGGFLAGRITGDRPFPLKVRLCPPTSSEIRSDLASYERFLRDWGRFPLQGLLRRRDIAYARSLPGTGVPSELVAENWGEFLDLLGCADRNARKTAEEYAARLERIGMLCGVSPAQPSREARIRNGVWELAPGEFDRLCLVLPQLSRGMGGGKSYLRSLPVKGVDTKFIEKHRDLIMALLRLRDQGAGIPGGALGESVEGGGSASGSGMQGRADGGGGPGDDGFGSSPEDGALEDYLGVLTKPAGFVLVRALDPDLQPALGGFRILRVPSDELLNCPLPGQDLIVVENEQTGFALPQIRDAVAVFGAGKNLSWAAASWIRQRRRVAYWGDDDSWGFGMLADFRRLSGLSPEQCPSLLMDPATLELHPDMMVPEPASARTDAAFLTPAEREALDRLLHWGPGRSPGRLEQERIRQDLVISALAAHFDLIPD